MSNKKKELIKLTINLVIIIIGFYVLYKVISMPIGFWSVKTNRINCPYGLEGNQSANLIVKYVDSPYCFWCWVEEPILKRAVATKGNLFMLERYDIRYCSDIVMKYGFSGTPSFVFALRNSSKEFAHMGFIPEETLNSVICDLSGGCDRQHDS